MITVINLRGYTNKQGKRVPYTKELLAVTFNQQAWFRRLCQEKLGGNMRGALVHAYRDGGDMSFRIGNPDFQRQFSEAALRKSFNNAEVRTKEGKLIKAAGSDMYPFDYDEVCPEKTADQLRAEIGGVTPAGSDAEVNEAWGEPQEDEPQRQAQAEPQTDEDELAGLVGGDDQGNDAPQQESRARAPAPASTQASEEFADDDDEIPF